MVFRRGNRQDDENFLRRKNNLAEQLLEDSGLTDYLDDAEAKRLLEWGISLTEGVIERSGHAGDAEAEEMIYDEMKILRRIIRKINRLLGELDTFEEEEGAEKLQSILEAADTFKGIVVSMPADIGAEFQMIQRSSSSDALTHILGYFS